MGTKKARNHGIVMVITIKIEMAFRAERKNILNFSGIWYSDDSMSLENRLSMRPTGVDSKNLMSQCKMDSARDSCNVRDARVNIRT
jgi:hypothetical protein